MARSKTLLIVLQLGMVLLGTGCKEHKRLESEIKIAKEKTEELRLAVKDAVKEGNAYNEGRSAYKSNPIVRKGPSAMQSEIKVLEAKVLSLEDQRELLKNTVETLQKDLAEYRAKNF